MIRENISSNKEYMAVKAMKQTKMNPKRDVVHIERLVLSERKERGIKSNLRKEVKPASNNNTSSISVNEETHLLESGSVI